jgi:hypothetical protein
MEAGNEVKIILVEGIFWVGLEKINYKQEFIRGSINQMFQNRSQNYFIRNFMILSGDHVKQKRFFFNLHILKIQIKTEAERNVKVYLFQHFFSSTQ